MYWMGGSVRGRAAARLGCVAVCCIARCCVYAHALMHWGGGTGCGQMWGVKCNCCNHGLLTHSLHNSNGLHVVKFIGAYVVRTKRTLSFAVGCVSVLLLLFLLGGTAAGALACAACPLAALQLSVFSSAVLAVADEHAFMLTQQI